MTATEAQGPGTALQQGNPMQVIYADRIVNMAIGVSVSRLTLTLDVGNNMTSPFATLVIPTPALFDVLDSVATNITNNQELKKGLIQALDIFRSKLTHAGD